MCRRCRSDLFRYNVQKVSGGIGETGNSASSPVLPCRQNISAPVRPLFDSEQIAGSAKRDQERVVPPFPDAGVSQIHSTDDLVCMASRACVRMGLSAVCQAQGFVVSVLEVVGTNVAVVRPR